MADRTPRVRITTRMSPAGVKQLEQLALTRDPPTTLSDEIRAACAAWIARGGKP